MRPDDAFGGILRRSLLLSGGSLTALAASVVANKVYSSLLAPEGFGLLALARSLVWLLSILGGAVLGSVLVREGAEHLARHDEEEFVRLKRACGQIARVAAVAAGAALLVSSRVVSEKLLAAPGHVVLIWAAALSALVTVYAAIETGELTARREHTRLARTTATAAVVGAIAGGVAVWQLGVSGIAVILLLQPLVTWAMARSPAGTPSARAVPLAPTRRRLLRAAWPVAAATLLGGAVEYALPLVIVQVADAHAVGLFRAAHALGVGYLAFLGTTLAQEYYPRLAALPREAPLTEAVNAQLRLVTGLAGLLAVVGILAAGPLLKLVFSGSFAPAAPLLALFMAGNVVRLPSWCLTYAVLAHAAPSRYLMLEAWGGAVTLCLCTLGLLLGGLRGLGVGFVVGYVLYFLGAWWTLRRTTRYRLDGRTLAMISAVAGSVLCLLAWTRWA